MQRTGSWLVALLGVAALAATGAWVLRPRPGLSLGLFVPPPEHADAWPGLLAALEERGYRHGPLRLRPHDSSAYAAAALAGRNPDPREGADEWVAGFDRGAPAPAFLLNGVWWAGMTPSNEAEAILDWMRREGLKTLRALDGRNDPNIHPSWEGPREVDPLWWHLHQDSVEAGIRVLYPDKPGEVDVAVPNDPGTVLQRLDALKASGSRSRLLLAAACAAPSVLSRTEGAFVILEKLKPLPKLSHPHAWTAYRLTLGHVDLIRPDLPDGVIRGATFTLGPDDVLEDLRTGERAVFQVRTGSLSRLFNLERKP